MEKLRILAESAKYDVSCSSSGTVRSGKNGMVGNTVGGVGICHSFADDQRLLEICGGTVVVQGLCYAFRHHEQEECQTSQNTIFCLYHCFLSLIDGKDTKKIPDILHRNQGFLCLALKLF